MDLSSINYPKLDEIKSALFIQPHPDDNEIGAGGTMAYLVNRGIKVYGLTATQGRGGSNDPAITPEMLAGIRQEEAQKAMDILGVINLGDLGYHDQAPATHDKLIKDIVSVIRKVRPDAIFSVDPHLPNEMHPVHLLVGKAVCEAFMRSGQLYYPYDENKVHEDAFSARFIGFYFTEDDNTIVDITAVYDKKLKAIQAHKSQIDETTLKLYDQYYEMISYHTGYKRAERLKLLSSLHTHCFALPKEIKKMLKD